MKGEGCVQEDVMAHCGQIFNICLKFWEKTAETLIQITTDQKCLKN